MLDRNIGTIPVKCIAFIGYSQVYDSAIPQHPQHIFYKQNGVLTVLDKMIGNHKILTKIRDGFQPFPVIDNINFN